MSPSSLGSGLKQIGLVNDLLSQPNKDYIPPPPNNLTKAPVARQLQLLPPKGWRIPNSACFKCGLKHPDLDNKTKCQTKLQNY